VNISDKDFVLIVDGLNLFTRHFVAHPATSSSGEHVGGIVGFLYAIVEFAERFKPNHVIVVWEGGGSSKRRSIYSEYKQKRRPAKLNRFYDDDIPDTVENRNHQISTLVDICKKSPISQMYVPDCEADDVIGYLCKYSLKNNRKLIISSDKDFYQLLDKRTIIYSPTWKRLVTSKDVIEKFGISPENFCLAKSICGDPSDNIAGVKNVGFKTLAKRFPDLSKTETMLIDDIMKLSKDLLESGVKLKSIQALSESEALIKRNWKLIYLDTLNLSSEQISKINYLIDNSSTSRDKITLMRILLKEGIQTFNIDRFLLSLNHIR
jgi:DNA polymerase-1